jgi:hypothetical protein
MGPLLPDLLSVQRESRNLNLNEKSEFFNSLGLGVGVVY